MHNKNYTQKYVYRFKTRKRIIKQAIMTGKQHKELIELLTKILAEIKLTNHKRFKGPIRAKKFQI